MQLIPRGCQPCASCDPRTFDFNINKMWGCTQHGSTWLNKPLVDADFFLVRRCYKWVVHKTSFMHEAFLKVNRLLVTQVQIKSLVFWIWFLHPYHGYHTILFRWLEANLQGIFPAGCLLTEGCRGEGGILRHLFLENPVGLVSAGSEETGFLRF